MLLAAPLTVVFAIPELFNSIFYGTPEIELTYKNSSTSVFLIRFIIIGILNISVIILSAITVAASRKLYFRTAVIYDLTAVNVMYILNFSAFIKVKSRFAAMTVSIFAAPAAYFLANV